MRAEQKRRGRFCCATYYAFVIKERRCLSWHPSGAMTWNSGYTAAMTLGIRSRPNMARFAGVKACAIPLPLAHGLCEDAG